MFVIGYNYLGNLATMFDTEVSTYDSNSGGDSSSSNTLSTEVTIGIVIACVVFASIVIGISFAILKGYCTSTTSHTNTNSTNKNTSDRTVPLISNPVHIKHSNFI